MVERTLTIEVKRHMLLNKLADRIHQLQEGVSAALVELKGRGDLASVISTLEDTLDEKNSIFRIRRGKGKKRA